MRSIAADLARSNTRKSLAAADVYARGVADGELRRQYEMPNAPRNYRSTFDVLTRLVDRWELEDKDDGEEDNGVEERENLLGGGVGAMVDNTNAGNPAESDASTSRGGSSSRHQNEERACRRRKELERKKRAELLAARDKFLRGETAAAVLNPANESSPSNDESRFSSGAAMFRHLDPRIRSVVIRAVSSASSSASTSTISSPMTVTTPTTYAARLLSAMEDVLVHQKMASDESRKLVDEILARPLVVDTGSGGDMHADCDESKDDKSSRKGKKNKKDKKTKNRSRNKNKVGSMAYRFHFEAATTNNATAGKNAGFHRLLLHAVCQFHGMNASSSTCSYRGGEDEGQKTAVDRVLTVTGTCRGREHRIVDEACRYMYMVEDS